MSDSPPVPRARPGDGRHDQLGNFQTALLGRITPASTRRSDSTARRSARYRGAVKTKSGSPPTPSHWPGNTAAMAIRKIAGLLEQAGWLVNDKRVERIWRREGLKVPHKQPSAAGSGFRMDHASGCDPSTAITSGPATL